MSRKRRSNSNCNHIRLFTHSDLPTLYTCAYIPRAELPSGVSAISLYLVLKSSSLAHALRFPITLDMRLYSSVVPSARSHCTLYSNPVRTRIFFVLLTSLECVYIFVAALLAMIHYMSCSSPVRSYTSFVALTFLACAYIFRAVLLNSVRAQRFAAALSY
jgi:hypothetical protein